MNPDVSYIVKIDQSHKEMAIRALKDFCVNTDDYQFDHQLITDDCSVLFVVKNEESTKWFRDHDSFSGAISGKTLIGNIQLWIRNKEAFCEFEFWAVSSSVGRAIVNSKEVEKHLLDYVKKLDGQSLILDDGSHDFKALFEKK